MLVELVHQFHKAPPYNLQDYKETKEFASVSEARLYCRQHSWREETLLINRVLTEGVSTL